MKHSEALNAAYTASKEYRSLGKKARLQVIQQLGAFGLFSGYDIHKITGVSTSYAEKQGTNLAHMSTSWNVKTLDALALIAVSYEDDEHVSPVLVRRVMQWGTPLRSIARLTGVPLERLRAEVHAE